MNKRIFISALVILGMSTMANALFSVYDQDGKVLYTMPITPAYADFTYQKPTTGTENGHDWVDLGLTSKTLWATCNVGANAPESYGSYYAWGETETHYSAGGNTNNPTWKDGYSTGYDWSTYFDTKDGGSTFVKYNNNGGKTELEDADDVVVQTWGGAWKMPTKTQQDELLHECDWEWTSINGVNGYKVKSRVNSNFIFFPAAGGRWFTNLGVVDYCGYSWSRSLSTYGSGGACYLYFSASGVGRLDSGRLYGFSVRPVCLPIAEP